MLDNVEHVVTHLNVEDRFLRSGLDGDSEIIHIHAYFVSTSYYELFTISEVCQCCHLASITFVLIIIENIYRYIIDLVSLYP